VSAAPDPLSCSRSDPLLGLDPLQRAQTEQQLSQNLLTGVLLPDLHQPLHAAAAPASSTHDTGRKAYSPFLRWCALEVR